MNDWSPDQDKNSPAVAWLESFINFEKRPHGAPYARREYTLGPFSELLASLDGPEAARPTIHIAGTKGKGSVAWMIDRLASAAKMTTGRYMSPHLATFRERIALDGEPIDWPTFERLFAWLKQHCDTHGLTREKEFRSLFELMTAGAWHLFRERNVDLVILEVGLGGRLDATNLVPAPKAAVITSIGLDHVDLLGDTVEKIAREKAGIAKKGCPFVVRRQEHEEAEKILAALTDVARIRGANEPILAGEVWRVDANWNNAPPGLMPVDISWRGETLGTWALAMLGAHQAKNLEVALTTFQAAGFGPTTADGWLGLLSRADLDHLQHPGRTQVVRPTPPIVVDGAHCPLSLHALFDTLDAAFPGVTRWTVLFGVLGTKRVSAMLDVVTAWPRMQALKPVDVRDVRALPIADLAKQLVDTKHKTINVDDLGANALEHHLQQAAESSDPTHGVVVTGTLFNVARSLHALAQLGIPGDSARG